MALMLQLEKKCLIYLLRNLVYIKFHNYVLIFLILNILHISLRKNSHHLFKSRTTYRIVFFKLISIILFHTNFLIIIYKNIIDNFANHKIIYHFYGFSLNHIKVIYTYIKVIYTH